MTFYEMLCEEMFDSYFGFPVRILISETGIRTETVKKRKKHWSFP